MKKYVKSSYTYDPWKNADMSEWSDEDVNIWNNVDWAERGYEPLLVPEDHFDDFLYIYGVPGEDDKGVPRELVTFVKEFRANTLYPPCYVVSEEDWNNIYNKYKKKGYALIHPMYDGRTVKDNGVTYAVMDRAETDELYDKLSR